MPLYRLVQLPFLFAPVVVWLLFSMFSRRPHAWIRALVVAWFVSYVLVVISVPLFEYFLIQEIARKPTPQREEMLTNDVGRNMAVCTGIPITLVWTTMNFLVLAPIDWLIRWGCRCVWPANGGEKGAQTEKPVPVDQGNPYQPPQG